MPGLQSFCICTALALAAIYLLQITWFTAWLAIDEKRVQSERNNFLPCVANSSAYKVSDDKEAFHKQLHSLCKILLHNTLFKVTVALITDGGL